MTKSGRAETSKTLLVHAILAQLGKSSWSQRLESIAINDITQAKFSTKFQFTLYISDIMTILYINLFF